MNHRLSFKKLITTSFPIGYSPINSIILNQWQHVVITHDSSTTNAPIFYINGVYVTTSGWSASGTVKSDALALMCIGNGINGDRAFDGLIDDVRVYNRALSAGEITALYNLGR